MSMNETEAQVEQTSEDADWTEFAKAEGLSPEAEAQPEKAQAEAEEQAETEPETEETEGEGTAEKTEETEDASEKQAKPVSTVKKLKLQRDEARQAAAKAEAELSALRSRASPEVADEFIGKAPTRDQFESVYDFDAAMSTYNTRKTLVEFSAHQQQAAIRQQEQAAQAARTASIQAEIAELAVEIPDVEAVLSASAPANDTVAAAIFQSENPARLAYAIAKQGLAPRLNAMTPMQAVLAIGRLEASMSKPDPKQTKAPDPVPASKGGATPRKTIAQMSDDELYASFEKADRRAFS